MAPSKRSQDVIALGKTIVDELNLTTSCETLAKWMAHYLAEQMKLAEDETDPAMKHKAEQQCVELILQLWKKRSILPGRVAPLANLAEAIKAIQEMKGEHNALRHGIEGSQSPWFEFAIKSYSTDQKMAVTAYLTGVLESDIGATKQWIGKHKRMLSSEERKLIESLDNWLDDDMHWRLNGKEIAIGTLQPNERTATVLRRLEELLQRQVEALQHLKMRVSPPEQGQTEVSVPAT